MGARYSVAWVDQDKHGRWDQLCLASFLRRQINLPTLNDHDRTLLGAIAAASLDTGHTSTMTTPTDPIARSTNSHRSPPTRHRQWRDITVGFPNQPAAMASSTSTETQTDQARRNIRPPQGYVVVDTHGRRLSRVSHSVILGIWPKQSPSDSMMKPNERYRLWNRLA